jgi:hypothetical protein
MAVQDDEAAPLPEHPWQQPADPWQHPEHPWQLAEDPWQPPWWLLAFAPLLWLLVGAVVLSQRDWIVALVALALLAPLGMPIPPILRWIHHHRRTVVGAYLGPVTFAAVTATTSLPLWLCTAITLCTTLLGLLASATRDFAHS